MRQWLRSRLTFANIVSLVALFVALGGTAMASVIITSNSQVAQNTISGHKPPSGMHPNIIGGSVNATDLANQAVSPAKLTAPEPWHNVGTGSTTQDLCANASNTALFCGTVVSPPNNWASWSNYGAPFATAGFYKDQLGIVHLKGLVSSGAVHFVGESPSVAPIFRLPPAYAPAHQRVFPSVGRNAGGQEISQGRVDVQPNGLVLFLQDCGPNDNDCTADGAYVTLDAISFRRDG